MQLSLPENWLARNRQCTARPNGRPSQSARLARRILPAFPNEYRIPAFGYFGRELNATPAQSDLDYWANDLATLTKRMRETFLADLESASLESMPSRSHPPIDGPSV